MNKRQILIREIENGYTVQLVVVTPNGQPNYTLEKFATTKDEVLAAVADKFDVAIN